MGDILLSQAILGQLLSEVGSTPGAPGKSAYQLWLDAGNAGDLTAFLASLRGQRGAAGKSAYDIWIDAGNVGAPTDFLTWLRGGSVSLDSTFPIVAPTANVIPVATSFVDGGGATWTLRMSDRTPFKNGVSTGLGNVVQLWYLASSVWAYMGTGWQLYSSSSGQWAPNIKPDLPTTAGLRVPIGPQALASHAGVQISAGATIQTVVDANPAGTTYVLAIGAYNNQNVVPKAGDTFIGLYNGTNGAVMDGQTTNAGAAFGGSAANVTIQNLIIKNYNNATQHGQIEVIGPYLIIQNCDISLSVQGAGVYVADYALVIANHIHANGQQGYSVHGDIIGRNLVGILFDSNEIDGNNPSASTWAGSEQGGGKALYTQYLTFWYNFAHDNNGSNFWTDANNIYTNYFCNQVGQGWNGIEHEISYNATIIGNVISGVQAGPGGLAGFFGVGAINIENSGGVTDGAFAGRIEIAYNTITVPQYGRAIPMRQQNRNLGDEYGSGLPRWLRNIRVHHNTIDWTAATLVGGEIGAAQDTGADMLFWGADRATYDYNAYTVGPVAQRNQFVWNNLSALSFEQWQAYGNDTNGSIASAAVPIAWDAGAQNPHVALSGAALVATSDGTSSFYQAGRGTVTTAIAVGAKGYWEVTVGGTNAAGGFCNAAEIFVDNIFVGAQTYGIGYYASGTVYQSAIPILTFPAYGAGDVLCWAVHAGSKAWVRLNGGLWNNDPTADPVAGTGGFDISTLGKIFPAYTVISGGTITADFGATTFAFSPPVGYSSQVGTAPSWNATAKNTNVVLSNGNLTATSPGGTTFYPGRSGVQAQISAGVKRYFEITVNVLVTGANNVGTGLCNGGETFADGAYLGSQNTGIGYYDDTHLYYNGGVSQSFGTFVQGDVICWAVSGGSKAWVRVNNGNWNNDILANQNPATGVGGIDISGFGNVFPAYDVRASGQLTANFSATATAFVRTPPVGFTGF